MTFVCGVDIGGTFTDAVVLDAEGRIHLGKRSSTPPSFEEGFFDALGAAAEAAGVTLEELLADTSHLIHGTTVATNAMVELKGAKVGLITTRGHRDVLPMMRSIGRVKGKSVEEIVRLSASRKPEPIVPRSLIEEVDERVDSKGEVVVGLDEAGAREAIQRLLDQGVEAIAISFLWSFINPAHELRVRELVEELAPGLFVTTSSELVPKWGEYERTAAVAINAFVGPTTAAYLNRMTDRLSALGYDRPLYIVECAGGVLPADTAAKDPVLLLGSGPVGGVVAAAQLDSAKEFGDIIVTDMGGTSFDVGLVIDGVPRYAATSVVNQYEFFISIVDVQSIGSGGGSIVWVDELSGALRVGPESAGARPGPACYGRGGTRPTVSDANLLLGYLNPEFFLGGVLDLDVDAARAAFQPVADRLGMSVEEAAVAATRVINHQMADLIRKLTIERGHHPRDFSVFSCGGAAGLHATQYTALLGSPRAVVPLGDTASVWSALGAASSDLLYVHERSLIRSGPFDPAELGAVYGELEVRARERLASDGVADDQIAVKRFADVKYGGQVNVVETPVAAGELDEALIAKLGADFEAAYERLFGKGSGHQRAGLEMTEVRIRAVGRQPKPDLATGDSNGAAPIDRARAGARRAWDPDAGTFTDFDVWRGAELVPGNRLEGPAIVELAETTVVLGSADRLRVDGYGNFICERGEDR
ncbi:MAG: hydantoinase/oxoprolinase family protein [Thermoleophilia bacterium]|nr:hydantoinase/oxoprolinase family protein [Thermoleophilia bacterium]